MLISGSSKAGKSFLLMELCIALAEGRPWLGFPCKKGRVLYVNLEIDPASCVNRFVKIYDALGYARDHIDDIIIWNLRGHAVPLDKLVPKLIRRVRDQRLDAIIIDPIYKVITGDENSASDMAAFCNQFDRICNETGCSTIYCHHHSNGDRCHTPTLSENEIKTLFVRAFNLLMARKTDAVADCMELVAALEDTSTLDQRIAETTEEIERVLTRNKALIREQAVTGMPAEEFDRIAAVLNEQYKAAEKKLSQLKAEREDHLSRSKDIRRFLEALESQSSSLNDWNEQAWNLLVSQVIIQADGRAVFLFRGEIEIMVRAE